MDEREISLSMRKLQKKSPLQYNFLCIQLVDIIQQCYSFVYNSFPNTLKVLTSFPKLQFLQDQFLKQDRIAITLNICSRKVQCLSADIVQTILQMQLFQAVILIKSLPFFCLFTNGRRVGDDIPETN